jgi:hypothetical protein
MRLRLRRAASDDPPGFVAADVLGHDTFGIHFRGEIRPFESDLRTLPTSSLTAAPADRCDRLRLALRRVRAVWFYE